jgi:hypothetical protein
MSAGFERLNSYMNIVGMNMTAVKEGSDDLILEGALPPQTPPAGE